MSSGYFLFICCLFQFHSLSSQIGDSSVVKKFYHSNGELSSEGLIINGIPNGLWRNYSDKRQLISEGNLKNGLADSTWKFYRKRRNS